jgi:hypothetical protein
LPDPHSQYTTAAEVNAEFNQFGVGADGTNLANADNAVLGSNNATRFDDNTAAVSGNYPDVGISSGSGPVWWNLVTYGTYNRTTQVATEVYGIGGGRPKGETFTRVKHDTWEPWVQNIFASDANFTAMPQVGGDPVVESGSNADGEWTRWADGTQIAMISNANGEVSGGPYTWTYPAAFNAAPTYAAGQNLTRIDPNGTGRAEAVSLGVDGTDSRTATDLDYYTSTTDVSARPFAVALFASGRWK